MIDDSIVTEVRAAREQIFAECGYDLEHFNHHMRAISEQLKKEGWVYADRPVTKSKTSIYETSAPASSLIREEASED